MSRAVTSVGRLLALAGAGLVVCALLVPVPARGAEDGSVTVAPRAESWYRTLPAGSDAALPTPPVPPPSPYPAGFLHVGATSGSEESRTYIALDLSTVPTGAEFTDGTLTLPIASDTTAGVARAETAKLRACHVPGFVRDGIAGDVNGAPATDCSIASSATYVAARSAQPAALVVDLVPFLDHWSGDAASLALLPEEGLPPTDSWHVAFSRRDREGPDAVPISARLELAAAEDALEPLAEDVADVPPTVILDDFTPVPDASFGALAIAESFAASPVDRTAIAQSAEPPVTQAQPVVSVTGGRFAYPVIFLLPFVIGAAIGWAGRAFTRDLQPPKV